VLLRLRPTLVGYDAARAESFQREVLQRVESLSGVAAASPATMPPLPGWGHRAAVWVPGRAPSRSEEASRAVTNAVGPRYFQTLGLRPLEGREFDDRDRPGGARVAIVNDTLARKMWPGRTAVGEALVVDEAPLRVVGVVRNVQYRSAGEPETPCVYTDFWQADSIGREPVDVRLHVRVEGDPRVMLPAIRRAIAEVDPEVPISEDRSLVEWLGYSFQPVRVAATVMTSFGSLGLLLSAIGLYGVLAFLVARRRREIAIRMAIGADAARVARLVVREGLRLAIWGAAFGTAATLASTRLAAAWLYGVRPADAGTLIGTLALLLAVALLACFLPARRAARLDPISILRAE